MNLNRDRITAPGTRDNDWAHTAADDVWFAATVRRTVARTRVADSVAVELSPQSESQSPARRDVPGATPYWE